MQTVRFFGPSVALHGWRDLVKKTTGKDTTGIKEEGGRTYCEVKLTPAEKEEMRTTHPQEWSNLSHEVIRIPR